MARKAYLLAMVLIAATAVFAVSVFGQGLDEDVAVAAEELVVDAAVADDGLPVPDGLELMALPGMDLPLPEVEEPAAAPAPEVDVLPLPADAILPVEEVTPALELPVAEAPAIEDLPVPALPVEELPELPVAEDLPALPAVADVADEALGGGELPVVEELPMAEIPAVEELPIAEIPVVEELPIAEIPVVEELPMAEIPAVEELPIAEIPVVEELPIAEIFAVEELPIAEIPAVEELPVAEIPVVEELPMAELPVVEELPVVALPVAEPMPVTEPMPELEPVPMVEPAPAIEPLPGVAPASPPAPELVTPKIESVFTGSENLVEEAVREAMNGGVEPLPNMATLPIDPRVAEISAAMTQEAIRRKAYETHALQTLIEAETAMQDEMYEKALKLYEEARRYLGLRVELEPERTRIMTGLSASCYEQAKVFWLERDWEQAKNMAKASKRYGHPDGTELLKKIQEDEVRPPPPPPKEKVPSRRYSHDVFDGKDQLKTAGYIEKENDVTRRFKLGKQYYQTEEYEKAQEIFETILKYDPHNIEAIRLLEKVARRLNDTGQMERETMRRDMVADVINTWNPRDYGKMEPDYIPVPKNTDPRPTDPGERDEIMKKLKTIVIPEIDFRQANINDVVEFLQEQSVAFDRDDKSARKGVNIILNLASAGPGGGRAAPAAAGPVDPFAAAGEAVAAPGGGATDVPLITFSARYISLLEALDIVTSVANLKHRIKGSVVMVVQKDDPEQDIVHRMYDVLSDISSKIEVLAPAAAATGVGGGGGFGGGFGGGAAGGGATLDATGLGTGDRADWKEFFAGFGVGWPRGASITYMPSVGKIFVANTPDNLVIFERILDVFNVTPSQIEIEARFVEVGQTDLDSLGIEWMLTDDWEVKQKAGQEWLPPGQKQRIVIPKNNGAGGFTKGNRYLSDLNQSAVLSVTGADDILSVASVLSNPELAVVLHALNQKGNTDLLSAPKITTKSGQQATIKVVTEYIYPTDFEVTPITATAGGGAGAAAIVGGIVQPGGFQTREVGVLLEVLPEVSTEGQLINLTLTPQVVGDPEWKNYGSTYKDADGNVQQLPMEQPFFHVRTITTSLSIYNGATVVMGGMITEHRNDIDDRIPILGDIPVLGRLFRSKYSHSQKRNLLIFVTARLVDPAGRPLKSIESKIQALAEGGSGGVAAPAK